MKEGQNFKVKDMRNITIVIVILFLAFSCKTEKPNPDKQKFISELNTFMDNWHHSAAVADEDIFFGGLDSNAVYLGTDAAERWGKSVFMDWGIKYFERDTAWAFVPFNRNWDFSEDMKYAWFDELLETHMGICRGSGVVVFTSNGWKIKQYNLAVTVPNEKMNEFRKINIFKKELIIKD